MMTTERLNELSELGQRLDGNYDSSGNRLIELANEVHRLNALQTELVAELHLYISRMECNCPSTSSPQKQTCDECRAIDRTMLLLEKAGKV